MLTSAGRWLCVSGWNVFPWDIVTFLWVPGQQNLWSAAHRVLLWETVLQGKNANEVIDIIYGCVFLYVCEREVPCSVQGFV